MTRKAWLLATKPMKSMTDEETACHLRQWIQHAQDRFAWPTDACGYDQHIRFVAWRNKHWYDAHAHGCTFEKFVLDYADMLEAHEKAL